MMSSSEQMPNRSLGEQLQAFYNCILVSAEEAAQRQLAFDRLKELVTEVLPTAGIHLVGSSASGLASKNSSVDLTVEVDGETEADAAVADRERAERILAALRRREGEFLCVQAMHSQRVSLVTCVYRQADLRCSVRLASGNHRRVAAFLGGVAALSEAFRLLTVVTREWALSRQLIRRKGALTGYAVALLVLFHLEQGGLVPPEVVRALARGHRKSEVSEALRRWQPEPLTVEQLGEQFCGLVRFYATLGFFASGAPCVLSGRLLDRGCEDPFPSGSRVSLPCPVSGENAGRTYSRVSEPEEPFFRTALNLAKDHDLFTACFARNLDGMRKAQLVQQLPAFRRLEEQKLVPPMQRLVERVRRTLETRGRAGYEKFVGRLASGGGGGGAEQQPQLQHQPPFRQQRPQSAASALGARASSSPKRPPSAAAAAEERLRQPPQVGPWRASSRPRPVLVLPRSSSGGRERPQLHRHHQQQKQRQAHASEVARSPAVAGRRDQDRPQGGAPVAEAASSVSGQSSATVSRNKQLPPQTSKSGQADEKPIPSAVAAAVASSVPVQSGQASAAVARTKQPQASKSAEERRPLAASDNREPEAAAPSSSKSLPQPRPRVSYASVVSGGKQA